MTKGKKDGNDDAFALPRFWQLWAILFAWWPLPDFGLDGRRRTTQAHRRFMKYAKSVFIANTLVLLRAYGALFLAALDAMPRSPAIRFIFASTSALGLALSWVSAQLAGKTIRELYFRLARIMIADHEVEPTSRAPKVNTTR